MSVTFSKSKGLYKDGIRIQCFFKHDVFTSALSVCRHDNGFITLDYHDDNGVHFIEVTDKDVDFLMFCDDSQTAFDYALSLIPPSENTDSKELVPATDSGVVDSVGDAPFVSPFILYPELNRFFNKVIDARCERFIKALKPFKNKTFPNTVLKSLFPDDPQLSPVIDDIPHFGLGAE